MKNKIIALTFIILSFIGLSSCQRKKLSDFQEFVNNIYSSEESLAGFTESNNILDNDFLVYNKETTYKIQRASAISSQVDIIEKKLSTTGETVYDETHTSYKTINDVKYTVVDGNTYENPYTTPTYFLTFVMSEDFLEKGYTLERNNNDFTLKAKVLDNKISSLFLNKSLGNLKDLHIEIIIKDSRLQSFNCFYTSENGFEVEIKTSYFYATSGSATATFHLEGGICQTSKEAITYTYPFNGTFLDTLIVDPNVLEKDDKDQIKKDGYHIEGWYQTKIVNPDGTITYQDKWDFETSRMDLNGVELYANWKKNYYYGYELLYVNSNNEKVSLGSYQVSEGQKFNINFIKNSSIEGFTTIGLVDEAGNPWDENYTHPGGDNDLTVKVYLSLIEGKYTVVKKARDFNLAISRNENIYLLNDIDFDGDELAFDSYTGIIEGNNHKLTNYTISYNDMNDELKGDLSDLENSPKNYLYISLFFELKDATIRNVSFDNMTVKLKTTNSRIKYIIISPLAISATNTKLENVSVSGTITVIKTPGCETNYITNDFWYVKKDASIDEDCSVNIMIE